MTAARAARMAAAALRWGVMLAALILGACRPAVQGVQAGAAFPQLAWTRLHAGGEPGVPRRGRPVVVNIWATWCAPCRAEMASLEALHRASPEGIAVVGVTVDDDAFLAEEFLRKLGVTFPNAHATRAELGADPLAVRTYPTTFVIDAAGVLRWREEAARDWSSAESVARIRAALGTR